jgi:hypothetical protein
MSPVTRKVTDITLQSTLQLAPDVTPCGVIFRVRVGGLAFRDEEVYAAFWEGGGDFGRLDWDDAL